MKGDTEVLLLIGFFLTGVLLGNFIALDKAPGWMPDMTSGAVTLLAAYLGARFAFQFNEHREIKRRTADQVAAGNQAIFALIKTYNIFGGTYN